MKKLQTLAPTALLEAAFERRRQGDLDEAHRLASQILAIDPNQPDALHLLGVIAIQSGNCELAAQLITRAVELKPDESAFRLNLGNVFREQGKIDAAIACFQTALSLNPNNAEAYNNLGAAFEVRGDVNQAASCYRQAVQIRPDFAEAYNNLGNALQRMERIAEAAICFQRTLELNPNHPDAHSNLAGVFLSQGRTTEAAQLCRRALELNPVFPAAVCNLGSALQIQGQLDEAIAAYHTALAMRPDFAEAYTNLGTALLAQGNLDEAMEALRRALELKPDYVLTVRSMGNVFQAQGKPNEAIDCYRKALQLKPDFAEVYFNLGNTLKEQGRSAEALNSYDEAVRLNPDYIDARANRSLLLLQRGDFERGWVEYEYRWKTKKLIEREFIQPRWDGSPLGKRSILLYTEQGFGDTFQFVRYAMLLKEFNPEATLIVECQRPLVKLLANSPGIDQLIAEGDALPPFDVQSPFLSLPRFLQTTAITIPTQVPYLFADSDLVAEWTEKLSAIRGFRIGINWQGRTGKGDHRKRDIPLELFASLATIPGVQLISLQRGTAQNDLASASGRLPVIDLGQLDTEHGAFMDTAAVMQNVDLVISSDTAVPHLAGALGIPIWVALPYVSDWRWLLDRSDCPWYSTMRLFRQKKIGDWESAFEEIFTALPSFVAAAGGHA
jgi:tetratricopeptide (TPR) repeat protein